MKEEISINDFAKIDIRIGTILAAEHVPETDKLIKCTVDLGEEEPRTIVSGIAHLRDPEDLVGKQVPYIANLAPRTIKGIESNGMLLAVGDSDAFALLHPDNDVPSGTAGK
ncbi:methionine--tRNA ligase subunit beta [bacterium]|nr:methionine--tRNA ligase subunit beta [bacterium]|tara:strand:- start:2956 stop:3288 length:333 start_codon:yes stop_codon:yes gene_type:complete